MAVSWRDSAAEFARILRAHGVDPDAVTDVTAAWAAFEEFLQVEIDGIDGDENDGDGFIIEWGRWSWNDHRPSLAFRRQLGVLDPEHRDGPDAVAEYWAVELELLFAESPAWTDLDGMESRGTGFEFCPIGAKRAAALTDVRRDLDTYPQLAALWRAEPVKSHVGFENVG